MKRARKHATSIALVVVAAALGTYAYVVDRGTVSETERKMRQGSAFVAWRREDLTRIEIARPDETLVLEKVAQDAGDGSWFLRSPRNERADDGAVDKLIAACEFASVLRKVDGDTAAGLDAPRARGTLVMGTVQHRFALGGEAPTPAGSAYLKLEGVGIVVVSRDFAAELLRPADTYRTRAIVPYLSIELKALEITTPAGRVAIERADDVSFRAPTSGLRISRSKLDDVWSALAATRAEAFVSDADADRLVASPAATLVMTPTDAAKPRGELLVGDACPGHPDDVVVVRKTPTRLSACAPKGILAGLTTPADALLDRGLFVAHDDEVAEVRIETVPHGPALDVARKEGGWRERAPADRDLDPDEAEVATTLAAAIVKSQGADPSRAPAPFEPKYRVIVRRVESGAAETVELAAVTSAGAAARRAFDGAILHVPPSVARILTPRGVALRPRALWAPPIEGKPARAIAASCEGASQRLTHAESGWIFEEPTGFRPDNASVVDFVDTLSRARADAWVADADDGTFGLEGAPCRASLTVDAGGGKTRAVEIAFGKEGEGGIYAKVDGAILVAPAHLRDLARASLVDRHGFAVAADRIDAIAITRAGKSVATPDGARDALALLSATDVVHLGRPRDAEGFASPTVDVRVRLVGGGEHHVALGRDTTWNGAAGFFARVDGTDATFFVARERVAPLLAPAPPAASDAAAAPAPP